MVKVDVPLRDRKIAAEFIGKLLHAVGGEVSFGSFSAIAHVFKPSGNVA
jgi:hypothetical protein